MKFCIICLAGLNTAMLCNLRFEVLNRIPFRDIASTIPPFPITAWTSVWTGADPSVHGKVPGIKGKFPKLPDVFSMLEQWKLSVGEYEEIDLKDKADSDVDIGIYRIESVANHILKDDLDSACDILDRLNSFIDRLQCPFMIISAFGATKYQTVLNVDKFLCAKEFMNMNGMDTIRYEESIAYPANYKGKKPRLTFGININWQERPNGFVETRSGMDIQGNLLAQLNKTDGITALSAQQVYDFDGEFFHDLPDVVLRSPTGKTYFRCAGETDKAVFSAYQKYDLCEMGMIASPDQEVVAQTDTVMKVKDALLGCISEAIGEC